jgi:hypothetical protein
VPFDEVLLLVVGKLNKLGLDVALLLGMDVVLLLGSTGISVGSPDGR